MAKPECTAITTVSLFGQMAFALLAFAISQDRAVTSVFANTKQQTSSNCTRTSSSKPMTSLRCAAVCGISPGCKGFSCISHSSKTCQCFLCSPLDGIGHMRLISGGTPVDCRTPPLIPNAYMTYSSTKENAIVTYKCQSPYYTVRSSSARCQGNGTWTQASPTCSVCPVPPMIDRTKAVYTETINYSAVTYSCVDADVCVGGTTTASCARGVWQEASIVCAPTTCWYVGNGGIPLYKGTKSTTKSGFSCNYWTIPDPTRKMPFYMDDANFLSDGTKAAASNFCRIFKDDTPNITWCFLLNPTTTDWEKCDVPQCPYMSGVLVL